MKNFLPIMIALPTVTALGLVLAAEDDPSAAAGGATASAVPVPVDDSMHHLMEYVFEPAYKRLKSSMPTEPDGKAGWSALKGDALTLAESSNLLLHRLPDDDPDEWIKLAVETRKAGGELYQSARDKDWAAAKRNFGLMLNRCNACHDKFADGDYQLEP